MSKYNKIYAQIWEKEFLKLDQNTKETILASPEGAKNARFSLKIHEATEIALNMKNLEKPEENQDKLINPGDLND